ncbi:MAG: hypothetical protein J6Q34_00770 [Bacteroidales bacterium]|nr:hypothetical protein [Bacteroidales bacterium]
MKKNLFYFFILMAVAMMPLASCEKENMRTEEEKKHDPQSDEDQIEITGYDGLEYFQNSIVVVDNAGKVVRRVCGEPLDPSTPDVISIPVKNQNEAMETFLKWIAPGKEVRPVEGGYDYKLTDEAGNSQGAVEFRYTADEVVLATLSVEEGTNLKMISQVNFVSDDFWGENDAVALYEAGKTYTMQATVLEWVFSSSENDFLGIVDKADKLFYCIQGNGNGEEAILVWLSPDTNMDELHPTPSGYIKRELYYHLPTEPEARRVLDFYNENQAAWEKMLISMDALGYEWSPQSGGETTGNSEFLLNSYDKDANRIKCLDLDDDEGEIIKVRGWSWLKYRYMNIRFFPPYVEE